MNVSYIKTKKKFIISIDNVIYLLRISDGDMKDYWNSITHNNILYDVNICRNRLSLYEVKKDILSDFSFNIYTDTNSIITVVITK
jgi:hypothetical protein